MCEKVQKVPRCERYALVPAYVPSEVRGALAFAETAKVGAFFAEGRQ